MKFGIKHDNGQIEALSRFPNDEVPAEFTEITKADYERFVPIIQTNAYVHYNEKDNSISTNGGYENDLQDFMEKKALREKLRELSIELDLQTRLAEDTTATQNEFDQLKAQYIAM